MNKSLLYNLVAIRLIHIVLSIIAAVFVSGLIALVTVQFTENIETIVILSLVGVWIAEVCLYILRSKMIFNKRMKTIEENNNYEIAEKKVKLIKRYVIFSILFTITFGFILYNLKDGIVKNIIEGKDINQVENASDNFLIIKIAVLIFFLIALIIRLIIRKRYKNNSVKSFNK